jgi:hypothetical protein
MLNVAFILKIGVPQSLINRFVKIEMTICKGINKISC